MELGFRVATPGRGWHAGAVARLCLAGRRVEADLGLPCPDPERWPAAAVAGTWRRPCAGPAGAPRDELTAAWVAAKEARFGARARRWWVADGLGVRVRHEFRAASPRSGGWWTRRRPRGHSAVLCFGGCNGSITFDVRWSAGLPHVGAASSRSAASSSTSSCLAQLS